MALANTEAKKVKFFGREMGDRVFLHPSSFNFVTPSFPSPFMVYLHKMKTDKTYLMDSAMYFFSFSLFFFFLFLFFSSFFFVSSLIVFSFFPRVSPLLLFFSSGNVHVLHENSTVVVDDWICMSSYGRVGVLLNELRFSFPPSFLFFFLPASYISVTGKSLAGLWEKN